MVYLVFSSIQLKISYTDVFANFEIIHRCRELFGMAYPTNFRSKRFTSIDDHRDGIGGLLFPSKMLGHRKSEGRKRLKYEREGLKRLDQEQTGRK